jgi:hypothetical protein
LPAPIGRTLKNTRVRIGLWWFRPRGSENRCNTYFMVQPRLVIWLNYR